MSVAIHYSSIRLPTETREVFGLQVAIFNWIKAYFRYGQTEKLSFLVGSTEDWNEIQETAARAGLDPSRLAGLDRRYAKDNFRHFQTIFRPDPHTQKLFWQRQEVPQPGYNVCALAHAIGGLETGEILEQYCLSPSESTDAIVCPSRAVQAAIRSFWDIYSDYLQQRFGTTFRCPVQLPIIPLGIDINRFTSITTPNKRSEQRQKLGLTDNDTVLLWVGRLSHAIKAHPLAMFQAAERAAKKTGASVHLIMVGYFVPQKAEEQFRNMAKDFCSKVTVTFIASDDPRFPDGLWAAGDIFLSLIDNMQESFGLTPIEAMAAGLPRVISDWDGYRDSVTHGEDGFLVRTLQPPPGQGRELSSLLANGREMYGGFLAKSALSIAVDQDMAAECLALLIQDKNKHKAMVDKARARVQATYDWKNIIPAYEALWKEMAERRRIEKTQVNPTVWPSAIPQAPDPFTMYASYPSAPLRETDLLGVAATDDMIKLLWRHEINVLSMDLLISTEESLQLVHFVAARGSVSIGNLFKQFPTWEPSRLWRTIAWLIKLGILTHQS